MKSEFCEYCTTTREMVMELKKDWKDEVKELKEQIKEIGEDVKRMALRPPAWVTILISVLMVLMTIFATT